MGVNDDVATLRRLGVLDPLQLAATTTALLRWGPSLAALTTAAALRHARRTAVLDHNGALTYAQLDRRSLRLANALRRSGLRAGDHLGVLTFNHADFVVVSVAAAKAGLVPVYLNTGFAAPQLGEVLLREGVGTLVVDAELAGLVEPSGFAGTTIVVGGASGNDSGVADAIGIDGFADSGSTQPLRPSRPVAPILLTSGTTGTPKGARRDGRPGGLGAALGLVERVPYRSGDITVIPTPLFHAWGLAQLTIALSTASTAVLVRRFEPAATLAAVRDHEATTLAVVPVMLQRVLAFADEQLGAEELTAAMRTVHIVASSGSALPAALATEWMDRTGDNLYNMYGSTEVGQATLATPEDLRAAPGTAGRVVRGSTVACVDADGRRVGQGEVGRIVVGNDAQFSGYTGGGTKEFVDGLMSSGDVGYFDEAGRLFVTGRADDMIVSGGENVFPREVEELLVSHSDIVDAAVYGVPDDDFGQRLAAQVVKRQGTRLTKQAVRDLVAASLARHKVPRDVLFVDELPRNATGKLVRDRLGAD